MKTLVYLLVLTLFSCGNNSHLFDNGIQKPTLKPVVERNSNADSDVTFYPEKMDSDWESELGFSDDEGDPILDGKVRITHRNCNNNEVLFDGVFYLGDRLDSDLPQEVLGGILDFELDLQPFYENNSVVEDGASFLFDKKEWSKHVSANYSSLNIYYHIHQNSSGKPIDLCTDYRVDNGEGYSDPTTTKFLVARHYSADNDALVDEQTREINDVLSLGGPVYIDPIFETDPFDPPKTTCSFERLQQSVRNSLTEAIEIRRNGVWENISASGTTYWDTIAQALGTQHNFRFINQNDPQPDSEWGLSCENYIELFDIYSATTDLSLERIRLSNGMDDSKYVEVELGIAEAF